LIVQRCFRNASHGVPAPEINTKRPKTHDVGLHVGTQQRTGKFKTSLNTTTEKVNISISNFYLHFQRGGSLTATHTFLTRPEQSSRM